MYSRALAESRRGPTPCAEAGVKVVTIGSRTAWRSVTFAKGSPCGFCDFGDLGH